MTKVVKAETMWGTQGKKSKKSHLTAMELLSNQC